MSDLRCCCCGTSALVMVAVQPVCRDCAHVIIDRAARDGETARQVSAWRRTPEGQAWITAAKAEGSLRRAFEQAA